MRYSKEKKDNNLENNKSIEQLQKRAEQLRIKYNEMDKKYIGYLEADMNRQAGIANKKKYEIEKEIYFLENRIESMKKLKKIKEEEMYGISQKMKEDLKFYKNFLMNKGLIDEFQTFKEEQETEELEQ